MSNELLEFTARKNVDFSIPAAYGVTQDEQLELKEGCQRVLTAMHKTVFDLCVVGSELHKLRNSGTWKYLNDDKHSTFQYKKFADFANYVFGFSETQTQNYLNLAKYVVEYEGEYEFLNPRYQDFNVSQLVEMSTMETWDRQKIQSNMTVTDIRLCKKYMKSAQYVADKLFPNFDLLTCARNWEEKEEAKKQAKADTAPDVLPGQMSVEEIDSAPKSELASDGDELQDEVLTDEQREKIIKKCLIERAGEWRRGIIFEAYKTDNLSRTAFVEYIKDQYGSGGFRVGNLDVTYNYKGYHITYGANDIFLTWTTAVGYIVSYINRGEYYTEPTHEEEYEPNEGEVWQGGGLDFDEDEEDEADESTAAYAPDEYDEADEAYEDMQADMQTIEEESERSIVFAEPDVVKEYDPCQLVKGMSPWVKPDFKNRDGIREFYRGFRNWEQVYSGVPFIEIYRYAFKLGTLYAVRGNIANILTSDDDERERTESVRYYWQEKGADLRDAFETNKLDLEKFIPLHKDEL